MIHTGQRPTARHIRLDDSPPQTAHGLKPHEYTHNRFAAFGRSVAQIQLYGGGGVEGGAVQTTDGKGGSHPPRHCEGKTRSLSPLGNGVDSHRRIWVSSRRRGGSSVWPVEGSQSVWEVMLTGRGKKECCQGHGGEEEIHICPLRHRWCRPPRMNRSGTASSQLGLVAESRKGGKGGGEGGGANMQEHAGIWCGVLTISPISVNNRHRHRRNVNGASSMGARRRHPASGQFS